ncbi:globin domain-containing protein [Dactylosporangium salmoneum]|uniref:nitric oxide dioxygenase n=1 Tax=Dactylosporangium salmoneum TaxID=53361 RepID=A0ABP5TL38_9ACTN
MLSDQARQVVAATLSAVTDNIRAIADRFYQRLFAAHPELIDGLFNRGNQATGAQQQAIAGAVVAFARAQVESPEHPPERLLTRIGHKHASLGVEPGMYGIVHDNLMAAIADVLGDAVTPQVAAAWDEVYWLLAHALINIERGLYSGHGLTPRTVWRTWEVARRIPETDDVVTFVVRRVDDRLVRRSLPGQYVTALMPMPDGVRQPRQYSLSRADDGRHRQFSVKRIRGEGGPDGEVSTLMCQDLRVGDRVTLSAPYGDVVLDDSGRPVVFASAGIGVTPMAGMLSHLVTAESGLRVMVLHADVDEESFPLRGQVVADIAKLPGATLHVWYERGADSELAVDDVFAGLMDISQVQLPDDALYYLCGPLPFMRDVRGALIERGVAPSDIQYEVFGPDLWQADVED